MAYPGIAPVTVPDSWTVWAASDVHGQRAAFDRLLAQAGLTDGADTWIAPPRTALVMTGDMVDRGPDSVGLVRRLVSLRAQAPAREGLVALLEGNHEVQVLGGLAAEPDIFRAFLTFGGAATLLAAGMTPDEWEGRPAEEIAARFDALVPDLRRAMASFAPYARWGDVLLVHGGPVPFMDLATWESGAERLWIRDRFFAAPEPFPRDDAWRPFRAAGLEQVVFGHTPVAEPTLAHRGRAVNLDTWRGQVVTLAQLEPGRGLTAARFLAEPTAPRAIADAPVTPEEVRAIDAALPPVVRAWWRSLREADSRP